MAKSVRSLRSKLLFNGGSPNAVRSLVFFTRSSSHSVAEVSRTATISPKSDQIAGSSEQPLHRLSFNDGRNAFRSKTTWEIVRALAIFRLCSFDFLVNRNKEVSIINAILRVCITCVAPNVSFYKQFTSF